MFSFYKVILDLLKARTHKYVRRVPIGATHTGATKYKYYYQGQEGHGKGVGHEEELVAGASFAFGEGDDRYHAHIKAVNGDTLTIEYDDGDKKGTKETLSKTEFQNRIHKEHATSIEQAKQKAKKQLESFEQMKTRGAKVKQTTIEKLKAQVDKIDKLVSPLPPADLDEDWMTEKEIKVFDGQNRIFRMLESKTLLLSLATTNTGSALMFDMLKNVVDACFRYKDLSRLSPGDKRSLLSITKAFDRRSIDVDYVLKTVYPAVQTIGRLWEKLPYKPDDKKIVKGRVSIINVDDLYTDKTKDNSSKIPTELAVSAFDDAKKSLVSLNPDLKKIIYGDVFIGDFGTIPYAPKDKPGSVTFGYYRSAEHFRHILDNPQVLNIIHSPDHVYLNTADFTYGYSNRTFVKDKATPKEYNALIIKQFRDTIIHEFAHRLSTDLLGNKGFKSELRSIIKEAENTKRTIFETPIKHIMIDKDIFPLMTWKIKNKTIDNQIEGLVNGDEYKIITPSEIDYTRLGDSVFSRRGPSNCFIIIPLKDGSLFTIQDPDPLSTIALSTKDNNPSQYAKKDDEEFFSEMMVAIANNEYTGEPTKTRFKALVDKYIPFFGKSVKDNQALLPI
jgi:hypothetical protein